MKKQLLIGLLGLALSFTASAIPINGSINFAGGTMTFSSTAVTGFGGSTTVNGAAGLAPTGDYTGTEGTAVTFQSTGFTFSPSYSGTNPLWTFMFGGNTYSFDLNAVTSFTYVAAGPGVLPSLTVHGSGILSISGGTYDDTTGSFVLASAGSGPTTFGFTAGNSAVPDGGTTASLLGVALVGMEVVRRKMRMVKA